MIHEEIKRFISNYLRSRFVAGDETPEDECDSEAEFILRYLHSKGVVLMVAGKSPLPSITSTNKISLADVQVIGDAFQRAYAGYVATLPLIEGIDG